MLYFSFNLRNNGQYFELLVNLFIYKPNKNHLARAITSID